MSICDEIFVNDSVEAVKQNILKVNFSRIDELEADMEKKPTVEIIREVNKSKETYVKFFDTSALEVIMAAEAILKERRKGC